MRRWGAQNVAVVVDVVVVAGVVVVVDVVFVVVVVLNVDVEVDLRLLVMEVEFGLVGGVVCKPIFITGQFGLP